MDTPNGKAQWREHFKRIRTELGEQARTSIDAAIANRVLSLPEYETCDLLLPYLSFGTEVETRAIIQAGWQDGKVVALPRCVPGTRAMKWYATISFEGLQTSDLGVQEPPEDPAHEVNVGEYARPLVLVPGLTFDAQGYRMGYGGGFYDVFLQEFGGASAGLCRTAQLSEAVPALDAHDLPVQAVVTETGILRPVS